MMMHTPQPFVPLVVEAENTVHDSWHQRGPYQRSKCHFFIDCTGYCSQKNIQSNYKQADLVVDHYKQRFGPEFSNRVCQTTPESLLSVLKHDDNHPKYTHVHIDEASSIYCTLFSSPTMKGSAKKRSRTCKM